MNVLDIRDASVVRGKRKILRDISWIILKGQHWALIGPNGSGKTTVLRVINGYVWPSSGSVSVLGKSFGGIDLRELRKSIGFVSSFISDKIPGELVVLDVVMSGSFSSVGLFGTPTKAQIKKAKSLLRFVGCSGHSENRYGTLSDGEKQRVIIARALMSSPKLLALDEPCSKLDLGARERFLALLQAIGAKKRGPTMIFATHHVEEIVPAFTHVMIIGDGRILSAGPKRRILTSQNLTRAFGVRVTVVEHDSRYASFVK